MSWDDAVAAEVLRPLGMTRTDPRPVGPAAAGLAVHPWADVVLPEPEHHAGLMAAAGQLWATLTDLGRFAAFLIGDTGDVLDPGTLEEMTEPAGVDSSAAGWSAYGLGVQVIRLDGRTYVGHGGSMPGFLAGVFVDREERTGAVSLANSTSGVDPVVFGLLADLRAAEPRIVEPWAPSPSPVPLDRLGVWFWGPSPYVLRSVGGGLLHLGPIARAQRPRQPVRGPGRRHVAGAGRLLRRGDAADRRGPPGPRHVHLHPHALRPGGARCPAGWTSAAGGRRYRARPPCRSGEAHRGGPYPKASIVVFTTAP